MTVTESLRRNGYAFLNGRLLDEESLIEALAGDEGKRPLDIAEAVEARKPHLEAEDFEKLLEKYGYETEDCFPEELLEMTPEAIGKINEIFHGCIRSVYQQGRQLELDKAFIRKARAARETS